MLSSCFSSVIATLFPQVPQYPPEAKQEREAVWSEWSSLENELEDLAKVSFLCVCVFVWVEERGTF